MAMDQPTITYIDKSPKKGGFASRAEVKELDELTKAWEEKHKESRVGKQISLGGFLKKEI